MKNEALIYESKHTFIENPSREKETFKYNVKCFRYGDTITCEVIYKENSCAFQGKSKFFGYAVRNKADTFCLAKGCQIAIGRALTSLAKGRYSCLDTAWHAFSILQDIPEHMSEHTNITTIRKTKK